MNKKNVIFFVSLVVLAIAAVLFFMPRGQNQYAFLPEQYRANQIGDFEITVTDGKISASRVVMQTEGVLKTLVYENGATAFQSGAGVDGRVSKLTGAQLCDMVPVFSEIAAKDDIGDSFSVHSFASDMYFDAAVAAGDFYVYSLAEKTLEKAQSYDGSRDYASLQISHKSGQTSMSVVVIAP